jgi:hypothetical protein
VSTSLLVATSLDPPILKRMFPAFSSQETQGEELLSSSGPLQKAVQPPPVLTLSSVGEPIFPHP